MLTVHRFTLLAEYYICEESLRRSLAVTHRRTLVECYISMVVGIWRQVIESAPSLLKNGHLATFWISRPYWGT